MARLSTWRNPPSPVPAIPKETRGALWQVTGKYRGQGWGGVIMIVMAMAMVTCTLMSLAKMEMLRQ